MNDMEKCFYEPAELSVVDEGKGRSLVKAKGSPYKLGFLVAQGADGIFKSLNDAEAVDAMERAIVGTRWLSSAAPLTKRMYTRFASTAGVRAKQSTTPAAKSKSSTATSMKRLP